jgi:insertion element IS1 protein InsB
LIAFDPEDTASTTLVLDELWSFVLKKVNQVWMWIALCRKTRQVVANAALLIAANRRVNVCGRSIHRHTVRDIARRDFWAAYSAVIPDEQHLAVGKETGETAHIERWNNTLRQRLAHFVRMTLSFSKSVVMLRPRVCSFVSIATIESGPFCSSEPLLENPLVLYLQ